MRGGNTADAGCSRRRPGRLRRPPLACFRDAASLLVAAKVSKVASRAAFNILFNVVAQTRFVSALVPLAQRIAPVVSFVDERLPND